jgi:poly(3-hydroxybutyrate) depolymerase
VPLKRRNLVGSALVAVVLVLAMGATALASGLHNNTPHRAHHAAAASSGCGKPPTLASGWHSIPVNGKDRGYILAVPNNYNGNHAYRVVFGFHWFGGTAANVAWGGYYGLQGLANNSTIFVAPQGLGNGWANAGGEDVTFVDHMVQQIEGSLCVDKAHIFSTGFSYGGAMSYSLACSRATVFRAVAVLSGGPISGCEGGTQPIAYLGVHGVEDSVLNIGLGRGLRDRFIMNNHCIPQNPPEPWVNSPTHIVTTYSGCSAGHPVEWAAFTGGHSPTPHDGFFNGNTWVPALVWQFFTQF